MRILHRRSVSSPRFIVLMKQLRRSSFNSMTSIKVVQHSLFENDLLLFFVHPSSWRKRCAGRTAKLEINRPGFFRGEKPLDIGGNGGVFGVAHSFCNPAPSS